MSQFTINTDFRIRHLILINASIRPGRVSMTVAGFTLCTCCVVYGLRGWALQTFLEWTPDLSHTNDTPQSKNLSEPQVPYRWNGEAYFSRCEETLRQCAESAASSESLAVGTFHSVLSSCGRSGSPESRRSPHVPLLPRPLVVCRTKTEHFKKNPSNIPQALQSFSGWPPSSGPLSVLIKVKNALFHLFRIIKISLLKRGYWSMLGI